MAGPQIKTELTFTRDPRVSVRDHNSFMRESNREAAIHHHVEHIPRHFEHFASAKYGYAPRRSRYTDKISYQQLKDRLGLPPLVSPRATGGKTKHAVTTQRTITATRKQAKLILRLPFRGGTGRLRLLPGERTLTVHQITALQLVNEIEVIANDEQRAIANLIEEHYTKLANKRAASKIRKRIN